MNDFKKNFENLNNDLNNENKNLISILIFGLLIGRLYEKFVRLKKNIRKKFTWTKNSKKL